ncbi:hypothetical protein IVB41_25230 [Bradyrhizobium sp. 44]|jgi:hypothetical protein|uniref:hypothetical protein n=1 Tax=unclassified Bradyrhizobium TaxID=2631580 RepID=UPI0004892C9B|nr:MULTISPECIES: hypothetical protein [unclassified Bradyrhizobium]MCK1287217.1 hypothetical protein [Bradyrhizobium sp. 44]
MLEKTQGRVDAPNDHRKAVDFWIALAFTAGAGVVTLVWLATIGWLIWQPLGYLYVQLFE